MSAKSAQYLLDWDRVLGLAVDGEARAFPHNILWSHEVVNDRFGDRWISVSYCPLTGSGLALDAIIDGSRVEFGASGLLFANNLVMFDRLSDQLLGPQLSIIGKCEGFAEVAPDLHDVREMSWGEWKKQYPLTRVLSDATGYQRNDRAYPYGSYDQLDNTDLLFALAPDPTPPGDHDRCRRSSPRSSSDTSTHLNCSVARPRGPMAIFDFMPERSAVSYRAYR